MEAGLTYQTALGVLQFLYVNHDLPMYLIEIDVACDADSTEVIQALEWLALNGLIRQVAGGMFWITVEGVNHFESNAF